MAEIAAEVEGRATSVVIHKRLAGDGTQFVARVPLVEMQDETDLLDRCGPGSFRLRYLNEGGKFVYSVDVRVGASDAPISPAPAPLPPPPPPAPSGEVAELRAEVAQLAELLRRQAAPAPPSWGSPPPAPASASPFLGAPLGGDPTGIVALASAMAAPSQRMTEALLPLFMQTIRPPEKDAGTAATETLLKGIDLGMAMASGKSPAAEPGEGSYADVIREVGVPLVQLLNRRAGGPGAAPAPEAPPVEVDPVIAELAGHARTIAARCAGLGPEAAAGLVHRMASEAVDGEVPGHEGVTWREILTDPAVRAAVAQVVPDVAQRAGWWEAFALDLWDLKAEEVEHANEAGETSGASAPA